MDAPIYNFIVNAVPVPQPRQRHRVAGRGQQAFVQNYTPAKHPVQAFKQLVQAAARQAIPKPLAGPVYCMMCFALPRPKRLIWKTRPMPREWAPVKPDDDNLQKSVQDALKGIAYLDDAQVCWKQVYKMYAAGDEAPHVDVSIMELQQ